MPAPQRPSTDSPQDMDITIAYDSLIVPDPNPFIDIDMLSSETSSTASAPTFSSTSQSTSSSPPPPLPPRPKANASDLFSIKASICHHHLRYATTLPWSGSCLDFDTRYCDECRGRERIITNLTAADPIAGLATSNSDLNVDMDVDMETQLPDFDFDFGTDGVAEGHGLVTSKEGLHQPMFCERLTESPAAMSEEESLVAEEFDGRRVYFKPGLLGENGGDESSSDDSSEYQYLSSDSEAGSALVGEENSDFEEEDETDDEPMSPDFGVSFSPGDFWVGEEFDL